MADNFQLRDILDQAADLSREERPAFLAQVCRGDPALHAEVESLLAALDDASDFVAESATAGARAASEPRLLAADEFGQVGPYKLLHRLGEGGMGVVYAADQLHPIRRRVAVKIIKPGMDTAAVIARFEGERQALALMDHANIARIYDAGTTAAGRPYFVMELIDGLPVTRYCDRHRLPAARRLELFIPVCRAVQHAHQKGIVHRDLKPGNVLVTVHDGHPVAKVIDFGIAKAVDNDAAGANGHTLFTRVGMAIGTPEYMSPEQVAGRPADVDTRSDVYALGVILYELLTGLTPLDRSVLREAGHQAVLRMIEEVDPPRPSTRLWAVIGRTGAVASAVATAAALRQTEPRKLAKLLSGDMDSVVMKCLAKDRSRRYDSASALARDLERFLNQEPVEARPPSRLHSVQRLLWRYRRGVAAAAAFAVLAAAFSLVTSVVFYVWKNEAAAQRDVAVNAEARAQASRHAASAARDAAVYNQRVAERAAVDALAGEYAASVMAAGDAVSFGNFASADMTLDGAPPALRNWEWNYLYAACNLERLKIPYHRYIIGYQRLIKHDTEIALSFNDFPADEDPPRYSVRFYDVKNGLELRAITDLPAHLRPVDVSRDGRRILALGRGEFVVLNQGGATVRTPFPPGALPYLVELTADGAWFAAGCMDGTVCVYDANTGHLMSLFRGRRAEVISIEFNVDATRLVTGDVGGAAQVWDWAGAKCLATHVNRRGGWVFSAFSPDSARVVSTDDNPEREGVVWDAATGRELRSLPGTHPFPNMGATFSPDGRQVAVCGGRFVHLFDAASGETVGDFPGHTGRVTLVRFTADGSRLLTSGNDNTARLWDVEKLSRPSVFGPAAHAPPLTDADITPDGRSVVTTTGDGAVRVYDSLTRGLRFEASPDTLRSLATAAPDRFDPAAARIAVSKGDGTVRIVDVATGEVISTIGVALPLTTPVVTALIHDGRHAITGTALGTISVWDLPSGRLSRVIRIGGEAVRGLDVSPTDDRLLVRGPDDGTDAGRLGRIHLWDLSTSRHLAELRHDHSIHTAEFSSDGKRIVTASDDTSAVVWDAADGRRVTHVNVHHYFLASASFSPDRSRVVVAVGDSVGEIWDVSGDRAEAVKVATLFGHEMPLIDARYSPDGTRIVTTAHDGTVCIWDAAAGRQMLTLRGHAAAVWRARFSRDGTRLITAADDGTIRLWDSVSNEQRALRTP